MNIYHEKQRLQLCALHMLNNLLQKEEFTKKNLDDICYELDSNSIINPHKSVFGLGNYDVNVLIKAVNTKDFDMLWFDKRKNLDLLNFENIFGLILNVPSKCKFLHISLPITMAHWVTIREIREIFYYFDSKNDYPEPIGQEKEVVEFLRNKLNTHRENMELFVIVKQDVAIDGSWLKLDDTANLHNIHT